MKSTRGSSSNSSKKTSCNLCLETNKTVKIELNEAIVDDKTVKEVIIEQFSNHELILTGSSSASQAICPTCYKHFKDFYKFKKDIDRKQKLRHPQVIYFKSEEATRSSVSFESPQRTTTHNEQNCTREINELKAKFQKLSSEFEDIKKFLNDFRKPQLHERSPIDVEPEIFQEDTRMLQDDNFESDFEWKLDDDHDWLGNDENGHEISDEDHPAALTQKRPKRFNGRERRSLEVDGQGPSSMREMRARKVEEKPQTSTPGAGCNSKVPVTKRFKETLEADERGPSSSMRARKVEASTPRAGTSSGITSKVPVTKPNKRSKNKEDSDSSDDERGSPVNEGNDSDSSEPPRPMRLKRPRNREDDEDPDFDGNSTMEVCRKKLMKVKKEESVKRSSSPLLNSTKDFEVLFGSRGGNVYHLIGQNVLLRMNCSKGDRTYVHCFDENCNGKGLVSNGVFTVTCEHSVNHENDQKIAKEIVELRFCSALRKECSKVTVEELKTIYDKVFPTFAQELSGVSTCSFKKVERVMKSWRKSYRNSTFDHPAPQNMNGLYDLIRNSDALHERFRINDEQFIHAIPGSGRSFVLCLQSFISPSLIYDTYYIRSTSKLLSNFVYEVLTLSVAIEKYTFPIAHIFIDRKSEQSYVEALHYMNSIGLHIQNVITTNNSILRRALRLVFPSCKIWLHPENIINLLTSKMRSYVHPPNYDLLRRLILLAYLPLEYLEKVYKQIYDEFKGPQHNEFLKWTTEFLRKLGVQNFSVRDCQPIVRNSIIITDRICEEYLATIEPICNHVWELFDSLIWNYVDSIQEMMKFIESDFKTTVLRKNSKDMLIPYHSVLSAEKHLQKTQNGFEFVTNLLKEELEYHLQFLEINNEEEDFDDYQGEEESEEEEIE